MGKNTIPKPDNRITIRISLEDKEKLNALAKELQTSPSTLCRLFIRTKNNIYTMGKTNISLE